MRHNQLKKELELLLLLIQNRQYTVQEICEKMQFSRRTLYYFLNFFREAGFIVEKHKQYYFISRESDFFQEIYDLVQFSDDEVLLIRELLENSEIKTIRMKALSKKLEKTYDFKILQNENLRESMGKMIRKIHDAIKYKQRIEIVGYSSPNSHTVKNRIVEPFLFMNNNNDIRCYELESGKNKTFKLSRMEDVRLLEDEWEHEDEHRKVYTDLFLFSGEQHMIVEMTLGQLSHNLLLEEYPAALPSLAPMSDGRWLFRTEVCSYLGVGRFVLGLYDDIEVLGDEGFKVYLRGKISSWAKKTE